MASFWTDEQVAAKTEQVQEWFVRMRLECAKACAEKQGPKSVPARVVFRVLSLPSVFQGSQGRTRVLGGLRQVL
jgi:hypothetical protein